MLARTCPYLRAQPRRCSWPLVASPDPNPKPVLSGAVQAQRTRGTFLLGPGGTSVTPSLKDGLVMEEEGHVPPRMSHRGFGEQSGGVPERAGWQALASPLPI